MESGALLASMPVMDVPLVPAGMPRTSKALFVISHLGKLIDRDAMKILKVGSP